MSSLAITPDQLSAEEAALKNSTFLGNLKSSFYKAVSITKDAVMKVGSLSYDFFKANPIITVIAADLSFTGGVYSQQALVGIVETVAGATGELASNAANGIIGYFLN